MTIRMLILDDEERILSAVSDYFDHFGYSVACARSLEEAVALLDTRDFDVVLADLRLSGIDSEEGLEIATLARRKNPTTRVALLTAYGTPEIAQEAAQRGVDVILNKPQPLVEIERIVSQLVSSRHG